MSATQNTKASGATTKSAAVSSGHISSGTAKVTSRREMLVSLEEHQQRSSEMKVERCLSATFEDGCSLSLRSLCARMTPNSGAVYRSPHGLSDIAQVSYPNFQLMQPYLVGTCTLVGFCNIVATETYVSHGNHDTNAPLPLLLARNGPSNGNSCK